VRRPVISVANPQASSVATAMCHVPVNLQPGVLSAGQ
jgi:hypothetical protein